MIGDVRDTVRGGAPLSSALERQHGLFSKLYINMVRAGEAGGSMQDTLQRLADYLERSRALRGKVINALIYPAILLAVVGCALLFLLGYVVPQFAQMYESLDVALPWFTQAVLSVGLLVRDWWLVLIVVPGVLGLWLDRKRRNAAFRASLDEWLLRQKVVGSLIARLETARLTRTLGTLLRNGVPLLAAIGIARNVMSNLALVEDVANAADDVKNGHGLSMSLARGKRFPRLALQMIQVGEESGALDTMLLKTADTFELETAQAIDRALAALVPFITLVLARWWGLSSFQYSSRCMTSPMQSAESGGHCTGAAIRRTQPALGIGLDRSYTASPARAPGPTAKRARRCASRLDRAAYSPQRSGDRTTPMREPLQWSPRHLLAAASFIDVQGNRS